MASDAKHHPERLRAYLTKQELAVRSGLSEATIQRYKDSGRIPFFQPGGKGGRVLFPLDAIESAQRELADSGGPAATVPPASKNPPKLPGPRPHWQTNPPTEMR